MRVVVTLWRTRLRRVAIDGKVRLVCKNCIGNIAILWLHMLLLNLLMKALVSGWLSFMAGPMLTPAMLAHRVLLTRTVVVQILQCRGVTLVGNGRPTAGTFYARFRLCLRRIGVLTVKSCFSRWPASVTLLVVRVVWTWAVSIGVLLVLMVLMGTIWTLQGVYRVARARILFRFFRLKWQPKLYIIMEVRRCRRKTAAIKLVGDRRRSVVKLVATSLLIFTLESRDRARVLLYSYLLVGPASMSLGAKANMSYDRWYCVLYIEVVATIV